MSGINFEFKGDYPFTPYVSDIKYENKTYSSIDLTGIILGKAADYTAAGIKIGTVSTFVGATDVAGTVADGVLSVSLEDLAPNTTYYVKGYTTVSGTKKYTIRYWYFKTAVATVIGAVTVTNLTDTTLTLNGSYNMALDTGDSVGFEYDTDAEFASPTAVNDPTVNTGAKTFTKNITGLTAGETYYVRAKITLVGNTAYSDSVAVDMNWTLTITPPTHGTITADPTSIEDGGDVLLTFTPAEGYELTAATVNAVSIFAEIVEGEYALEDVQESKTIAGTFTLIE